MTLTQAEIMALLTTKDERERARVKQALRDAEACRESRRVSVALNDCTCFCCVLDREARAQGMTGLVA